MDVLLPVIRPEACQPFCEALAASDIPRCRVVLVQDAPGCECWHDALDRLGFDVEVHATGNDAPAPREPLSVHRARQRAMRAFTLTIPGTGPLLLLDDDAIVPPDVYARLTAIGPHATAVQVSRIGTRTLCGVYLDGAPQKRRAGIELVDSCGHYCLLTTWEMYRTVAVRPTGSSHVGDIEGLKVDWDCIVGHWTPEGVLYP